MSIKKNVAAIVAFSLLAGCGTTGQNGTQVRKLSSDEAFAFIRDQKTKATTLQPQESEPLYVQPLNKTEPCKLQTDKEQQDRNNFQAFWDGKCKNGFAFGLGRDIAISDTHHLEEITTYGDNGKIIDSPSVLYDFVHNVVEYRYIKGENVQMAIFREVISNDAGNFSVTYSTGLWDRAGNGQGTYWSPFDSQVTLVNIKDNVFYRFVKNDIAGTISPTTPIFGSDTLEKESRAVGGYAMAAFSNGQIRHFKMKDGRPEFVLLPESYTSHISVIQQEISNSQAKISADIEKAKRMEKEYLYFACNGKHAIQGLDVEISTKICAWRSQFQEQFQAANKRYGEKLEEIKAEAQSQEERRQIQEQIDYKRRMVEAAERQASAAENANFQSMMNQTKSTTCYTNYGITTCY